MRAHWGCLVTTCGSWNISGSVSRRLWAGRQWDRASITGRAEDCRLSKASKPVPGLKQHVFSFDRDLFAVVNRPGRATDHCVNCYNLCSFCSKECFKGWTRHFCNIFREWRLDCWLWLMIHDLPSSTSFGSSIPLLWRCGPTRAMASSFLTFLDHTQRRITVGRTPLEEWSARRRSLYLTTQNTHNKHPCPRRDSNPRSQQASGRRPTP